MKRTLLLNASSEVLELINDRRALKLSMKDDKVEVLGVWDDIISWGSGQIYHPAILRLKKLVRRNFTRINFNRQSVIKRDYNICQYCGKKLLPSQITIDHIVPKDQGGLNSFTNCVVSCKECNNRKDNRTPEQAGMKLLRKPISPIFLRHYTLSDAQEFWHDDWDFYLGS